MPGIPFAKLIDHFALALEQCGATVFFLGSSRAKPSRLLVAGSEARMDCLVFLWTITPGGDPPGTRPANERRIQVTSADEFPMLPGVRTIVGGWSEEFGAYAFWDPRRHSRFSHRSPSLQVGAESLEEAASEGVSAYVRPAMEGREVVVAVAPRSLLWYLQQGQRLHDADEDAEAVEELAKGTPEVERQFLDSSESESQAARRYELVESMRAYRDASFRPAVMQAYGFRCAVCGTALRLVDAAHIVPVFHPRATDDVTNGMALCRQHHGAFDNALLGVQSNYRIVINPVVANRLKETHLDSGLDAFCATLPRTITLPTVPDVRPNPRNLRIGLEARQWPDGMIA